MIDVAVGPAGDELAKGHGTRDLVLYLGICFSPIQGEEKGGAAVFHRSTSSLEHPPRAVEPDAQRSVRRQRHHALVLEPGHECSSGRVRQGDPSRTPSDRGSTARHRPDRLRRISYRPLQTTANSVRRVNEWSTKRYMSEADSGGS
ncbi:hypothetical protein NUW58_g5120 [Xylaria curta]|uniref:Uncharacterized protein n=1 Tax=Xylaria curta TaxID=42375 RepID=A0ACC1P4S5_9PEZI|nr:hypothetical protein NUW58_g5120 [Xylaria curta]